MARYHVLDPAETVIVAVSTGVDSMALLHLLEDLPAAQRPRLVVAHVNHHLRAQSADEVAFLMKYCQQRHLTLEVADWQQRDHPKTGIEAAGRAFRYAFFGRLMHDYQAQTLMTAHHANDQVETYLMKLARGGELNQLTGIAVQRAFLSGQLVRPLLKWSKAQLRQYAQVQQLPFFEDATNQDVHLTRNRIRQRVVPELMMVNPELLTHVASYEQQLTDLYAAQRQMVTTLLPTVTAGATLDLAAWQQLPPLWQRPVLRGWLINCQPQLISATKLTPVMRWLVNPQHPSGQLPLGRDYELVKRAGRVTLTPAKKRVKKLMPGQKIMVDLNQWQKITATDTVGLFTQAPVPTAQPFRLSATDWPLSWRPWQTGDRLALKGGGHQPVRRILIDQKVPVEVRDQVRVLVNAQGSVLWVVGYKFSYRSPTFGAHTVFLALKHRS
ncbi:tRNA lysidine(34) synthetase TilS [Lactiplantibacillus modestisalitolerans]|uniref:tRNA(Ile)-lysidine synthase n=1 Tax=Lactiplantibacillus modestisalitolerans TaxID=1457219 RepID=A0ABV5WWX0_9LACO|nr:tRNA lysidine(34) synthetase TilS [Lactiplantibacillus modestisalitolerans]